MRLIISHFSCIFNPLDHAASTLDCAWDGARQAERLVDQGLPPDRSSMARQHRLGDLIDLHIADMCAIGKPPRRSKAASLSLRISATPALIVTSTAPGTFATLPTRPYACRRPEPIRWKRRWQ